MKFGVGCLVLAVAAGTSASPERLIYHDIQTDRGGRIVPWHGPPARAYDHVIRLVWKFWNSMRKCPNGVPYYMQNQDWKAGQEVKRGLTIRRAK
jgi:hypothetical protein